MGRRVKILIVDDHKMIIDSFKEHLSRFKEFEVVGESHNGIDAIRMANELRPDIILMDIHMEGMCGIEAAKNIMKANRGIKIILLSAFDEYVYESIEANVAGYILKEDALEELTRAINEVSRGNEYFSTKIQKHLIDSISEKSFNKQDKSMITDREKKVVKDHLTGKSIKDTADFLSVSPKTVEKIRDNLKKRYGISNILQYVEFAIKNKIVQFIKKDKA
jgi:DNA-binding NarL/FixJ family response regulator